MISIRYQLVPADIIVSDCDETSVISTDIVLIIYGALDSAGEFIIMLIYIITKICMISVRYRPTARSSTPISIQYIHTRKQRHWLPNIGTIYLLNICKLRYLSDINLTIRVVCEFIALVIITLDLRDEV